MRFDSKPPGYFSLWAIVAVLLAAIWLACMVLLVVGAFTGKD